MAKRYHLTQKDRDLLGRTIRRVEGMGRGQLPLPQRRRLSEGGSAQQPIQLALIVSVLDSGNSDPDTRYVPGSPPYELDFQIGGTVAMAGTLPLVGLVLLDVGDKLGNGPALEVHNPMGLTLEELTFYSRDVRKDGIPRVGEVVRVWTSDGRHVKPPEGDTIEGGEIVNNRHWVYCDALNATDHLRSLTGYVTTPGTVKGLVAEEGILYWTEAFEGPEGPQGDPGAPGADGDTVSEGYCITIADLGGGVMEIHHDAITADAGTQAAGLNTEQQQFWIHFAGATVAADAKWQTAIDYSGAAACQLLVNFAGSWEWATLENYNTPASAVQLLVNFGTDWQWETLDNYDTAKDYIIHIDNGNWKVEEANKITIKSFKDVAIAIVGTPPDEKLRVTITYDNVTVFGVVVSEGTDFAEVDADPC